MTLSLEPAVIARLTSASRDLKTSRSKIVEEAVTGHLDQIEKANKPE